MISFRNLLLLLKVLFNYNPALRLIFFSAVLDFRNQAL